MIFRTYQEQQAFAQVREAMAEALSSDAPMSFIQPEVVNPYERRRWVVLPGDVYGQWL